MGTDRCVSLRLILISGLSADWLQLSAVLGVGLRRAGGGDVIHFASYLHTYDNHLC